MSVNFVLPNVSDLVKFRNQDFEKIRSHCRELSVLWEDPLFTSDIGELSWKRPWEIVPSPCLFQEKATSHDVRQGILQDGYLAVAMQALTARTELLHWVVPRNQKCSRDNSGVVHLRIWQLGTWYDVCVDDRLPTKEGKLAYIHSKNNKVFWCALLEKAYAKLCGSYKAVETGHGVDAMVDFSGGISEIIPLDHPESGFGNSLLKAYEKKLLMCCEIINEDRDVRESVTLSVRGSVNLSLRGSVKLPKVIHYYAITRVQYIEKSKMVKVKIKDPEDSQDSQESTATKSDSSSKFSKSILDTNNSEFGVEVDSNGEFWLSELDFKEHFTTLSVCHLGPDTFANSDGLLQPIKSWWPNSFKGEWVKGLSAGGTDFETAHQNYQYRMILTDPDDSDPYGMCGVLVTLMQKNKPRKIEWNLGFKIFRLHDPAPLPSLLDHDFFANNPHNFGLRLPVNRREVVSRQQLSPGIYCIIPCTKNRNEEGEFLLRVFTGKKASIKSCEKTVGVVEAANDIAGELIVHHVIPVAEENKTDEDVVKLFCRVSRNHMTVDWEGLKTILDSQADTSIRYSPFAKFLNVALEKISSVINFIFSLDYHTPTPDKMIYSKELCRALISFKDVENTGKIGFDQFDDLWSHICQWKLIYHIHRKRPNKYLEAVNLGKALEKAGFILNKEVLGILIHRYADELGNLSFDDFIMCIVTLHVDYMNFENSEKEIDGQVAVTLNDWIKKSFFY